MVSSTTFRHHEYVLSIPGSHRDRLAAFASLVDRGIPSNPLWAEVLASQQRQARDDAR